MVTIQQADIWWAELDEPAGSGAGYRRPVLIIQGDALNASRLATVVCVALTSQLAWADAPGNLLLKSKLTGLPKDSVANVSQIVTLDKRSLTKRAGRLSQRYFELVLSGIEIVLGR